MHIRFNKIDGFIRVHGGEFICLLFDHGLFDKICEKSGITDNLNNNFGKIRIDSYNSLAIEKILAFHNLIIHIKSVVNKNKNEY